MHSISSTHRLAELIKAVAIFAAIAGFLAACEHLSQPPEPSVCASVGKEARIASTAPVRCALPE